MALVSSVHHSALSGRSTCTVTHTVPWRHAHRLLSSQGTGHAPLHPTDREDAPPRKETTGLAMQVEMPSACFLVDLVSKYVQVVG